MTEFLEVDPSTLHLPFSHWQGAIPWKLQRQIARHGRSIDGMPQILVEKGSDGALMIVEGVTRATRVAKLLPGVCVRVEIMRRLRQPRGHFPTVGDRLP